MSFKDLKITAYQDSVSALPDYPSDAGITAAQLKAVFDGRTDKEIKTKFNALIDELITKFGLVGVDIADAVENHNQDEAAHEKIIEPMRDQISDILLALISMNISIDSKADGLETANQLGALDLLLSGTTNELQEHISAINNPHKVTAAQVGTYKADEIDELIARAGGNVDMSEYYTKGEIDYFRIADEMNMERHVGVRIDESLGDISSALDELHEYAVSLAGGEN